MGFLSQAYQKLLAASGLLAGVLVAGMALGVTVDVVSRNLGFGGLPWMIEVSENALYMATFLAAPWVLSLGAHVRVDLVLNVLSPGAGRVLEIGADLCGLGVSLVFVWFGYDATADAARLGSMIAKQLVIPEWWLLCVIPLSFLFMAVEFVLRLRRAVSAFKPAEG
ncbi:MAG: TRAP transporter small permease subunit [Deferrisomatales bacterium]|nr:TRAP transporter small permease subunit [Deferrisomatales bacterium]